MTKGVAELAINHIKTYRLLIRELFVVLQVDGISVEVILVNEKQVIVDVHADAGVDITLDVWHLFIKD